MEIKSFFLFVLYAFAELFLGSGGTVSSVPHFDEEEAVFIDIGQAFSSVRKLGQNLSQMKIPEVSFRTAALAPAPAKKVARKVTRPKRKVEKRIVIQDVPKNLNEENGLLLLSDKEIVLAKNIQSDQKIEAINDKELVEHYGFVAEPIQTITWSNYFQKLDLNNRLAQLEKEEASRQLLARQIPEIPASAPLSVEKTPQIAENAQETKEEKALQNAEGSNDLPVFYAYTQEDEGHEIQKTQAVEDVVTKTHSGTKLPVQNSIRALSQVPLSSTVGKAIHREIKNLGTPKRKVATQKAAQTPVTIQTVMTTQAMSMQKREEISTLLRAFEVEINNQSGRAISSFQLIPDYDKNQTFSADESGSISFTEILNDSESLLRGTLIRQGVMRTKIEIPLSLDTQELVVPMLTQGTIERFIEENAIGEYGGFLLVDLGEHLDDVDIDREYQGRFFLNQNFKVVDALKDCRYVLYAGVDAGNVLIQFLLPNGQAAQKIGHVVSDEVLFESGHIASTELKTISLFERRSLSVKASELEFPRENIRVFGADVEFAKEGLNRFEALFPARPLGARHFVDLARTDGRLFVGFNNREKLEIPSQDFIDNIFAVHELNDLEGPCIVQMNFDKPLQNFTADGDDRHGAMSFRKTFLDKNGIFSEDVTNATQKAFLLGETPGIFNIKVEYQDGTTDYLQSFCSESAYLVEVL